MKKVAYIKGLDGLRFLGAFLVLFHHIEKGKVFFNYSKEYTLTKGIGHSVMTLFFTLSGFLIISILLNEKKETGTINLTHFYKKRAARIWPIYYLIILLSVFIFENNGLFNLPVDIDKGLGTNTLLLYIFQLPNYCVLLSVPMLAACAHLWTVGVEEQFYFIAPFLIKKINHVVKLLVGVILFKVALVVAFYVGVKYMPLSVEQLKSARIFNHFLFQLRFEAFAIGGLAAYIYIENKTNILIFINKPFVKYFSVFVLLILMIYGNKSQILHVILAMLFCIIILNLATSMGDAFFLENKYVKYLGKISYGIYIYQVAIIYFSLNYLQPFYNSLNVIIWNVIYYFLSIFMTVLVSVISYELIESKLLRLVKNK